MLLTKGHSVHQWLEQRGGNARKPTGDTSNYEQNDWLACLRHGMQRTQAVLPCTPGQHLGFCEIPGLRSAGIGCWGCYSGIKPGVLRDDISHLVGRTTWGDLLIKASVLHACWAKTLQKRHLTDTALPFWISPEEWRSELITGTHSLASQFYLL